MWSYYVGSTHNQAHSLARARGGVAPVALDITAPPFLVADFRHPLSIPAEIRRRIGTTPDSLIRPHPAHHPRRYNIVRPPRFCPAFAPPRPTFVQVSSNPDSLESGIPLVYFWSTPSAPHRGPYDSLAGILAGGLAVAINRPEMTLEMALEMTLDRLTVPPWCHPGATLVPYRHR